MAGYIADAGSLVGASLPQPRACRDTTSVRGSGSGVRLADLPWPVLAYLVTIYFPISFNVGPLVMSGTRLFLMVLIVPLTFRLFRGDYGRIILTDILFFFFVFWLMIAMRFSDPGRAVSHVGSMGIEFLGGYMITRAYIRTPEDFRNFCWALAIFILATLPLVLIELVTAHSIMIETLNKIPGLRDAPIPMPRRRLGLDRVSAVFEHAILYGLFCATCFSLVFVSLRGAVTNGRRWTLGVLVAFCAFSSLSSAPTIALTMQISLILWSRALRWFPLRWLTLTTIICVGFSSIILVFNRNPFDVLADNFTYDPQTAHHRAWILEWGLINVQHNPWFGIGLNDWERPWDLYSASVDNFWLLMAMRYGIPAFLAVALGFVLGILHISLRRTDGDEAFTEARLGWVISMIALSFVLATVFIWGTAFSLTLALFGAGMWMITYVSPAQQQVATRERSYSRSTAAGNGTTRPLRREWPACDDGAAAARPATAVPATAAEPAPAKAEAATAPRRKGAYTRFPARPPVTGPAD